MSQENVEGIRALHEAFSRGDYAAALAALAPDVEWHPPPGIAIGEKFFAGAMRSAGVWPLARGLGDTPLRAHRDSRLWRSGARDRHPDGASPR